MMVFSILRSGSTEFFTTRSKVAIGFFLVSINVFSAQLWADTCRKFSPIEYVECIYIKDDARLDPDAGEQPVYLPETLMSDRERTELIRRTKAAEGEMSAGPTANFYGTFADTH